VELYYRYSLVGTIVALSLKLTDINFILNSLYNSELKNCYFIDRPLCPFKNENCLLIRVDSFTCESFQRAIRDSKRKGSKGGKVSYKFLRQAERSVNKLIDFQISIYMSCLQTEKYHNPFVLVIIIFYSLACL
jgi:hypothetical protein